MRVSHVRHDVRLKLNRSTDDLSLVAQERVTRLRGVSHLAMHEPVRQACIKMNVSRATFYRWSKRLEERGLKGLEPTSRRPHNPPPPTVRRAIAAAVENLRRDATTNKDALVVLLKRQGLQASASTVGRTLRELFGRGVIQRYVPAGRSGPYKPRPPRPHAVSTPKNLRVTEPGEVVQVDTLHIEWEGVSWRQFSALDINSRTTAAQLGSRARAQDAADFLKHLVKVMPFEIHAIQVDRGSEFKDAFEAACKQLGIILYENHARTPKQNAYVERQQRTFRDEFYRRKLLPEDPIEANALLQDYVHHFNHYRPHGGLRYLTPMEYLHMREPLFRLT
jgi:transposase InsO family protein